MDVETHGGTPPDTAGRAGATLRLEGMADVRGVKRLRQAALAMLEGPGDVTVDASGVPHLDTAALQVLLALRATLVSQGRAMRFVRVADSVRTFLRHAGLEHTLLD